MKQQVYTAADDEFALQGVAWTEGEGPLTSLQYMGLPVQYKGLPVLKGEARCLNTR